MARAINKEELLTSANKNFNKLWDLINSMPEHCLNTPFDFSADEKKKEAHWTRDNNLRDVLIHLHEWHLLLIKWIESNKAGENKAFLPESYNWKNYGELNIKFWEKHQGTTLEESKELVMDSHKKSLELIQNFTTDELFTKGYFNWTGSTSLGSYCVSALPSHYDWAIKKLKAHFKIICN